MIGRAAAGCDPRDILDHISRCYETSDGCRAFVLPLFVRKMSPG